jgi:hypothetical protein
VQGLRCSLHSFPPPAKPRQCSAEHRRARFSVLQKLGNFHHSSEAIQKKHTTRYFVFDINFRITYKVLHALEHAFEKLEAGEQ